eukprot:6565670-Karenia_brevis.AAC.1
MDVAPVPGAGLVAAPGSDHGEHPAAQAGAPALCLQRRLTDIVDRRVGTSLGQSLARAGRWSDVRRVREVSDSECSHDWLWSCSPETGPVLSAVEFVTAVRLRVGGAGPDEPAVCGICGIALLDASAAHAL